MDTTTLESLMGLVTGTWLLVCMYLYRSWRAASWLAGSTVAAALFFTGTAMICSLRVQGSYFLAPLWVGMLAVLLMHLRAALRSGEPVEQGGRVKPAMCPITVQEDVFI